MDLAVDALETFVLGALAADAGSDDGRGALAQAVAK